MLISKCSTLAISLAFLALIGGASAQPAEQPSPETLAKLIARLHATDFRVREKASDELVKFGETILPALRKAATANNELEAKRRIELVVSRIEDALLKAEEKQWQDIDAPRRGIKDRLIKILARTPALTDQQVTSAIYLLAVARAPTDEEVKGAKKQFAETKGRRAGVLQLARSLVQSKEYSADIAASNGRLLKVTKDQLNDPEITKVTEDVAAALNKKVKTDEQFADVAFLLVLSRFPDAQQAKQVVAHLKMLQEKRAAASADIIWVLMNTREFLKAP